MDKADEPLLTRAHVARKLKDMAAALAYERSVADVQFVVESRKRANAAPTNYGR